MSVLENITSGLRASVELSMSGVMTGLLFVALPWAFHGAEGHFAPVYELASSEGERDVQITLPSHTLEKVMDGDGEDAVVDAPQKGDGTTKKVEGVETPEPIVVNRVEPSGTVMQKKQLGVTRVRGGLELQRVAKKPSPKKRKRKGSKCLDPVDEIQSVGPHEWQVDRDFVMLYTQDMDRFNSLGRVVRTHDDRGKPEGWQLRRIRCGSPLHQGGFRNGDVLLEVDGREVASIRQVFRAYRKSKRRDVIRVKVRRKGQMVDLKYTIG